MTIRSAVAAGATLLALLVACRSGPPTPDTVATSELGGVTRGELEAFLLSQPPEARRPAPGEDPRSWREGLLRRLLTDRGLEAEAREGLSHDPELRAAVADARDGVLVRAALAHHPLGSIEITEEELRREYETDPSAFERGEGVRLRHIFRRRPLDAEATAVDAVRQELEEIRRRLAEGAHFDDLARRLSDSTTADRGGDLGVVSRGTLPGELERVVWALEPGEVSGVVATPEGFHLFTVEARVPARRIAYGEARPALFRRLSQRRSKVRQRELLEALLSETGARYEPERLSFDQAAAATVLLSVPSPDGERHRMTNGDFQELWRESSFTERRAEKPTERLLGEVLPRLLVRAAELRGLPDDPALADELAAAESALLRTHARNEREARAAAEVPEPELRRRYAADPSRWAEPQEHRLRLLEIDFPADAAPYRAYEEAARLRVELERGEVAFDAAARRWSSDPSRDAGGELDWIRLDELFRWAGVHVQRAFDGAREGDLLGPILLHRPDPESGEGRPRGYLLVEVLEVRGPRIPPFEEVRERVARDHLREHSDELRRAIEEEVLREIGARLFPQNL